MNRKLICWLSVYLVLLAFFGPTSQVYAENTSPSVVVLDANGPLTPAMEMYINRGLSYAASNHAAAVVIQLDTPGGSTDLMDSIVQKIRASSVPVIVYVTPAGAMAGSAGTVISLAGHILAMAPQTAIGAASPVDLSGSDISTTERAKIVSIMTAEVRGLAKDRPPEAIALAEATITDAKAVSSDEALKIGLIDIQAADLADLLRQSDGRKVIVNNITLTLNTANASTSTLPSNLIEELLAILTNPNIVFLLLSLGVQAILIELASPGGWVAGFIGAVCLLFAAYGLGVIPVNWTGLLFIVVAFVLFILDIKAPTHGALTLAGVASFIVGGLILFNSVQVPGFTPVSVPLVIGTGIVIGLSFFTVLTIALRAQRAPLAMSTHQLIGKVGIARTEINPHGQVQVGGELWSADLYEGSEMVQPGTRVEVLGIKGLRLLIRKIE